MRDCRDCCRSEVRRPPTLSSMSPEPLLERQRRSFSGIFGGWIQVWAEDLDPGLILESLKAGRYYSSQGPEIHDIRIEDDEIVVESSPAAVISVQGKGSRAKFVKGNGMTSGRIPRARFKDDYIRITVSDAQGHRAWSNPIWRGEP